MSLPALDWSEPGDLPGGTLKRAKPLEKPFKYVSLTPELERELIRRHWKNGDQRALDWLGAHRPMVVAMARSMWRGNRTSLEALIEYGMLGVRLAAEPPRPSLTKKGEVVGFDLNANYRFSTYARHYALKEMRAALADDPHPERSEELEAKADLVMASWWEGEATAEEWESEIDDPLLALGGHRVLMRDLQRRDSYAKPYLPWTLWHPPAWAKDQYKRSVRPRDFRKHPRTETELVTGVLGLRVTFDVGQRRDGKTFAMNIKPAS